MTEKITTYKLSDPSVIIPMERDLFYAEQIAEYKKNGKPSRACEIIGVLIFTVKKELILQKRSHLKNHNPYLIDKTIGGHVQFGDSFTYTTMVETVQELRVPSIVLRTNEDFLKTYLLLKNYLESIAILKQIDQKILFLERIIKNEKIIIANKLNLFLGVYDGPTKPVDREASGVLYYDLNLLKEEMKVTPSIFTQDLRLYIDSYGQEIDDFIKAFD